MVKWLRWHCPPDTGFEIRALAVWGRVRYLSVTEAPHNTDFHTWMRKNCFCFFQTAETGNRTPNSGVKGSGANHYPRAPAQKVVGRSKNVDWAVHDRYKDAANGGRTVHGRNKVSGWGDFKRAPTFCSEIFFHERSWDVGQERCSETGPQGRCKFLTCQELSADPRRPPTTYNGHLAPLIRHPTIFRVPPRFHER